MDQALVAVMERFPDRRSEIARLVMAVPSFRAICEDYWEIKLALDRWQEESGVQAALRVAEYRILLEELAAEIDQSIRLTSPPSPPPKPHS